MKYLCAIFLSVCILSSEHTCAQLSSDYSISIDVTIQDDPPQITLDWINDINATAYDVFRKGLQSTTWGAAVATLPGTASQYIDNTVEADTAYEYKIYKTASNSVSAYGYVYAGIKNPVNHYNGRILVLIDSLFIDSVATELWQFQKDLASDGWDVTSMYFSRTDSVASVKSYIMSEYNTMSNNVKAVMLVGHIPVPYSGNIYPDGHTDHQGAWPADVYYGDINGTWTDEFVNATTASRPENINTPGDGKFDQSNLPSDIELQVGRIDFFNMPSSGKTEYEMLKNYLNRDHAFRKKEVTLNEQGLIDDNFGAFSGEAFACNGFKNFAPLVGKYNIEEADFLTTLEVSDYLWAYGCGGGYYSSAGGIGNSAQMMTQNVNSIFTMLFGSYFGDWDSEDNFLRSPLCSNTPALTCVWAGRPHWMFHTMGLGLNIGYGTRVTQNNSTLYDANYGSRMVHIALMGDLTLKQNVLAPPQSIILENTSNGFGKTIDWVSSADEVLGYYVYRSSQELQGFELISDLVTGNTFTDTLGTDGLQHYLVRALRLETTSSGSYYNLSEGVGDSSNVVYQTSGNHELTDVSLSFSLYPNPATDIVTVKFIDTSFKNSDVHIFNQHGELLKSEWLENNKMNVENLCAGVYIISISQDQFSQRQKLVIIR